MGKDGASRKAAQETVVEKKLMRDKAMAKKVKLASSNTNDANGNSKNRPGTAKAKEVDEERIEIDIMDDLAKDDEDGKSKIAPPKDYISGAKDHEQGKLLMGRPLGLIISGIEILRYES